jgi:hypothetical protein
MADFTCDPSYLAPTGFKITISRENYPNLQFFAQQVQHPSMSVNHAEVAYKRIASVPVAGDVIEHGSLSLDVLMDENMRVYEEIYDWLHRIVETKHKPNTGRLYATDDTLATYCDIRVSVLTSHNNANRELKYVNAIPTTLGDIAFTSTSEGEYITFPVTFRFDYFEFA